MELLLLTLYLLGYPIICSSIEALHDELLLHSFGFLRVNDQSRIDSTTSRFHNVLRSNTKFEELRIEANIKKIKQLLTNNLTRSTVDTRISEIKPIIHKLMDLQSFTFFNHLPSMLLLVGECRFITSTQKNKILNQALSFDDNNADNSTDPILKTLSVISREMKYYWFKPEKHQTGAWIKYVIMYEELLKIWDQNKSKSFNNYLENGIIPWNIKDINEMKHRLFSRLKYFGKNVRNFPSFFRLGYLDNCWSLPTYRAKMIINFAHWCKQCGRGKPSVGVRQNRDSLINFQQQWTCLIRDDAIKIFERNQEEITPLFRTLIETLKLSLFDDQFVNLPGHSQEFNTAVWEILGTNQTFGKVTVQSWL